MSVRKNRPNNSLSPLTTHQTTVKKIGFWNANSSQREKVDKPRVNIRGKPKIMSPRRRKIKKNPVMSSGTMTVMSGEQLNKVRTINVFPPALKYNQTSKWIQCKILSKITLSNEKHSYRPNLRHNAKVLQT